MGAWAAQQWAPIVADAVPFIIGFFFVLGMMAQDKPRQAAKPSHNNGAFAPIKSNAQIIEEMTNGNN